jgi:hypothetical protein
VKRLAVIAVGLMLACHGGRPPSRQAARSQPAPAAPAAPAASEAAPALPPMPLAAGTTWSYQVTTTTYDPDAADQATSSERRVEARVVAAVSRGGITAAHVHGLPGFAEDSLVVARGDALWIDALEPTGRAALSAADGDLASLVAGRPPLVQLGAADGVVRCDDADSEGPMYCWMLEPALDPERLAAVVGLPIEHGHERALIYRSNPDDTAYGFAAGVGLTSYAYHHHGSPDDTEAALVELRLP